MHVISFRILRQFGEKHSDCQEALSNWYKVAKKATWTKLIEVQQVFPKAEAVGNFTVFNIKGNKYRLIVSIDYLGQLIYIKTILTHVEYDKEEWNGGMTLIFNYEKYKELLASYVPKLIKTEEENEQALAMVEDLMHRECTIEEDEVYQLLITLIEKFEQEYYEINERNNPLSMLFFY